MKTTVKNYHLSWELNVRMSPERGNCFFTALAIIIAGWCGEKALYVEGGIPGDNPDEEWGHAWVEVNGEIIDAQLPLLFAEKYRRVRGMRRATLEKYCFETGGPLPRFVLP